MTGSMVERSPRTMSTSAGFGGLRSSCASLAVRGLIVVGFAGVAWLLSASAAHASDESSRAPQGDVAWSVFGAADQGGLTALAGTGDAVSGLVQTLAGDHHRAVRPVGSRQVGLSVEGTRLTGADLSGADLNGADLNGADLNGAHLNSAGVDLDSGGVELFARIVPLSSTIPVQDLAGRHRSAVDLPVSHLLAGTRRAARTATWHHASETGAHPGGSTATALAAHPRKATPMAALGAPSGGPATTVAAATGGTSEKDLPGKDGAVTRHTAARHIAGGGTTSSGSPESFGSQRTRHVPLLPRPAPDPALPGAGLTSGVPGLGSGPSQDDGAPAIPPATTAASAMAGNRSETADAVAARTLITESPTVSPD